MDSSIFIYAIEDHPEFGKRAQRVLASVFYGDVRAVASTLVVAELMVMPYRRMRSETALHYVRELEHYPNLTLVAPDMHTCLRAAQLRATSPALKLPDAVHLATAISASATGFVTNDKRLGRLAALEIVQLGDLDA